MDVVKIMLDIKNGNIVFKNTAQGTLPVLMGNTSWLLDGLESYYYQNPGTKYPYAWGAGIPWIEFVKWPDGRIELYSTISLNDSKWNDAALNPDNNFVIGIWKHRTDRKRPWIQESYNFIKPSFFKTLCLKLYDVHGTNVMGVRRSTLETNLGMMVNYMNGVNNIPGSGNCTFVNASTANASNLSQIILPDGSPTGITSSNGFNVGTKCTIKNIATWTAGHGENTKTLLDMPPNRINDVKGIIEAEQVAIVPPTILEQSPPVITATGIQEPTPVPTVAEPVIMPTPEITSPVGIVQTTPELEPLADTFVMETPKPPVPDEGIKTTIDAPIVDSGLAGVVGSQDAIVQPELMNEQPTVNIDDLDYKDPKTPLLESPPEIIGTTDIETLDAIQTVGQPPKSLGTLAAPGDNVYKLSIDSDGLGEWISSRGESDLNKEIDKVTYAPNMVLPNTGNLPGDPLNALKDQPDQQPIQERKFPYPIGHPDWFKNHTEGIPLQHMEFKPDLWYSRYRFLGRIKSNV